MKKWLFESPTRFRGVIIAAGVAVFLIIVLVVLTVSRSLGPASPTDERSLPQSRQSDAGSQGIEPGSCEETALSFAKTLFTKNRGTKEWRDLLTPTLGPGPKSLLFTMKPEEYPVAEVIGVEGTAQEGACDATVKLALLKGRGTLHVELADVANLGWVVTRWDEVVR